MVLAFGVLRGRALERLGLIPRRDTGVGYHSTLGIPDGDMQIAGRSSLSKTQSREHKDQTYK